MGKFVVLYTGGSGMGMTEEERGKIMAEWGVWYEKMGAAIMDGGDPFGASKHANAEGTGDGPVGSPPATGYTIISSDSLDAAVKAVQDHPHIKYGGEVTVYETFQVM